jgi:hypothetical protein
MRAEEQAASAYERATDGCCRSVLGARDNAQQWQRIKPDEETNPLAGFDWEKEPRWDEPLVTTPLPLLCSGRTDCIALVIQPLVLFSRPIGKDPVAAM